MNYRHNPTAEEVLQMRILVNTHGTGRRAALPSHSSQLGLYLQSHLLNRKC